MAESVRRPAIVGAPRHFPRLHKATEQQRENVEISGGGTGLQWDESDEDISVPNLLVGVHDRSVT